MRGEKGLKENDDFDFGNFFVVVLVEYFECVQCGLSGDVVTLEHVDVFIELEITISIGIEQIDDEFCLVDNELLVRVLICQEVVRGKVKPVFKCD